MHKRPFYFSLVAFGLLTACQSPDNPTDQPAARLLDSRQVYKLIPVVTSNRMAWANDIVHIMHELEIKRNLTNTCSIIAVVDQESNFVADPMVAGLGHTALTEMNQRLEKKLGKAMAGYFNDMLAKQPSVENNFLSQLQQVKTERELDQLYRQIFDYFTRQYKVNVLTSAARLIARQDIAETFNPVTTLGSMQVHIQYAQAHSRSGSNINQIRDDLYTQYGGLYYGIHRLMTYPASYQKPLYRFADYNSGMYSSRNAAFQHMINQLSQANLELDGDLLAYDREGDILAGPTGTEKALAGLFSRAKINLTASNIRHDLKKEKQPQFEKTQTYFQLQQLYQQKFNQPAPYAMMPQVIISGPKLRRDYNTKWYASRVNQRYTRCVGQGKRLGFSANGQST